MSIDGSASQPNNADIRQGIIKRAIQLGFQFSILAAILFLSSGRLDWWMAWLYLGIFVVGIGINTFFLMRTRPELIAERAARGEDTKGWDKIVGGLYGLFSALLLPLVAGLDMRFDWPPPIPLGIQVIGLLLTIVGFGFASWAMISNAYFAGTVRIQKERGHAVCDTGPYRLVRHPGYSGWMLGLVAMSLMLGSLWALIPAALAIITLIIRTAFEDRTLQTELPGYADYAQHTRYRLLPGIW